MASSNVPEGGPPESPDDLDLAFPDGPAAAPAPERAPAGAQVSAAGTPARPSRRTRSPESLAVAPARPRSAAPVLAGIAALCLAFVGFVVWRGRSTAPAPAPRAAATAAATPFAGIGGPVLPAPYVDPPAGDAEAGARAGHPREAARPVAATRREPPPTGRMPERPGPGTASAGVPLAVPAAAPSPAPAGPETVALSSPALAPPVRDAAVEDAPRYASAGFVRPRLENPACVRDAVRLPRGVAERLHGPVTVRFAVGADGEVSRFELVTPVERRVGDAIEAAVRSCRVVPGADPQGRPTSLWVVLPVRFGE